MKRKKEIFWGVLLILGAVYILANQMGYFYNISLFCVVFTILLVGILAESLAQRSFGGILFSLAFLCNLYDKQLGIEALTPVPVFLAALFGTIGLNLVFRKKSHYKVGLKMEEGHWDEAPEVVDAEGEIHCAASFQSATKYINSPRFRRAVLESSFGSMAVYLDQAAIEGEYGEVRVDVSFGNIELYIPKDWKPEINVDTAFGGVKEDGGYPEVPKQKTLLVSGSISFGGLEIHSI